MRARAPILIRNAAFVVALVIAAGAAGYGPCSADYNPLFLLRSVL